MRIMALLLAMGLVGSVRAADGDWPIPEHSKEPGAFQRQYGRYHVGPLMQEATRLIGQGDYAGADAALVKALDFDRGNSHVKLMLVRNSERVGKEERGLRLCEELVKEFPKAADLLFDQAYLAIKAGKDAVAVSVLERYLTQVPGDGARQLEAWKVLAEANVRLGQYDKAARYAELWMKRDHDPRALMVVAESLARQERWAEALKVLDGAVGAAKTAEQRGVIELKRGYMMTGLKDYKGAQEALTKAADLLPKDAGVRVAVARQLGMNAVQAGDYAGAVDQFKTCLEAGFDESLALAYLQSLLSAGRLAVLAGEVRGWLAAGVFSPKGREAALRYLMFAEKNSGNDQGYYVAATTLASGGGVTAMREAGEAALRLRKYEEAAGWFTKAQEIGFDEATVLGALEALSGAGKWDACAATARRALAGTLSEGGRTRVWRSLMYAEKNRGNNPGYQEAARELLKAADLSADLREAALAAGRMGQVEDSIRLYKRSLEKEYSEPGALSYVDALMAGNQWAEASAQADALLKRADASQALKTSALRALMFSRKNLGDQVGYLEAARRLVALDGSREVLAEAALAAWRNNETDQAVLYFEQALAKGYDASIALNYAFVIKLLGRFEDQEKVLLQILNTEGAPDSVRRSARYELAQNCLKTRRIRDYLKLMEVVVKESPEPSRLREYATQLYLSGDSKQATALFAESLKAEKEPARRHDLSMAVAELLLAVGNYEDARFWFNEACKDGSPDEQWRRQMGRVEYEVGNFEAAAGHLVEMKPPDDLSRLYAGFAFYRMGMPGLALYHLNRVANPQALSLTEQNAFYANRAFLNYDQDQNEQALSDADKALSIQGSPELQVARLRILLALGRNGEVIDGGQGLMGTISNGVLRADIMDLTGRALYAGGNGEAAVTAFTEALQLDPGRTDLYYLRGMAYRAYGRPAEAAADLQMFQDKVGMVPATYWADRGVTEGMARPREGGVVYLKKGLLFFPYEVDSLEEMGYQLMRLNDRVAARDAFRRAIDVYDEILPVMTGPDAAAYRENRLAMKKQQTTLDKAVGFQAYLSKTDYNLSSNEVLLSIDGALPSQYGAEISWRPPDIGFRNERIFEVFGRALGNFEQDSWTPDEQSYQGGVGARYKPFAKINFNTSFERLFKIGDNAEDNWLWRNMISIERGTRPVQEAAWWTTESVYGEVSYYLEAPERWIYYADGRIGLSFPLGQDGYLTLPQLMAVGRYQSDDPAGIGTYSLVGVGATARLLQAEQRYAVQGWYLDGFIHYTWGWFEDTPAGFDKRSFDGVMFGLNFVK